jgi:hypothetical protein
LYRRQEVLKVGGDLRSLSEERGFTGRVGRHLEEPQTIVGRR